MRTLLLFLLWPVTEILLFILAGDLLGLWPTLGLVFATTALGVMVLRRQKASTLAQLRALQQGRMPAAGEAGAMAAGAGNYIAGILLVLPGFAGDLIGLLLLLPPVRRGILAKMAANMTNAAAARGGVRMSMRMQTGPRPGAPGDIIDGEATEITPEATALPGRDPAGRRPSGWQQGPDLRD